MRDVDGILVNWLDTSITRLLSADTRILSRFAFIMVTSIDSSDDMTAMSHEIVKRRPGCSLLGGTLLVPGDQIAELAFELFNGFDELWCFDEKPKQARPRDLWIMSPLNLA